MQKKTMLTVLSVILAMIVASLTLVFAVGPLVDAWSPKNHVLVLDDWDDFDIDENGVLHGYSAATLNLLNSYAETGCGLYWYDDSPYDEIHVKIPEGVKVFEWLDRNAERGFNSATTSVTLPNGLEEIGYSALYYTKISSLVIPDTVTRIGDYAFSECWKLNSIVIPAGVEYLGEYAFTGCQYDEDGYDYEDFEIYCECDQAFAEEHWGYDPTSWDIDYVRYIFDCKKVVTFDTVGGSDIDQQKVLVGSVVEAPANPSRDGHKFVYWYTNNEDEPYDFDSTVESDLILHAKWEAISSEDSVNQNEQSNTPANDEANENKGVVAAAVGGTVGGVTGLGAIGTIVGVVVSRRRKK